MKLKLDKVAILAVGLLLGYFLVADIIMSLDKRTYECSECGLKIDRDLNASINIKNKFINQLNNAEGHSVKVFGDSVRPCFEFTQDKAVINELETSVIILK